MKLALLIIPVVASIAYWYAAATPWFCSGLCCLSEKACKPVRALGSVDEKFEPVKEAFEESLTRGWDFGASVFVAVDGNTVVDLAGGFQDRNKPFDKDTASLIFSSGKVLEGIAVAIAVEQGLLELNDPISKHWPEFVAADKAEIIIADLLQHRSGSSTNFETTPDADTLKNTDQRDVFLASQKFPFPRGRVSYRGWGSALYTDALLRRVDPNKRSLATFVQDELMDSVGGTLSCPPVSLSDEGLSAVHEASLLTMILGILPQVFLSPVIFSSVFGEGHPTAFTDAEVRMLKAVIAKDSPPFSLPTIPDVVQGAASYNNESSFLAYPMLSSNCFSNARSLGKAVDAFFRGKVVSDEILKQFTAPLPSAFDHFSLSNVTHSVGGFGIGGNVILLFEDWECIGWGGLRGSVLQHCKVGDKAVTFSYVPNGLSPRVSNTRGINLMNTALEIVQRA